MTDLVKASFYGVRNTSLVSGGEMKCESLLAKEKGINASVKIASTNDNYFFKIISKQ